MRIIGFLYLLLLLIVGCTDNKHINYNCNYSNAKAALNPKEKSLALGTLSSSTTKPSSSDKYIICLNKNLEFAKEMAWRDAKTRFTNPVVVLAHGREYLGSWFIFPDKGDPFRVDSYAWILNETYIDCDIVLFVCNPSGLTIYVPRVWYYRGNVWVVPDTEPPAKYREMKRNFMGNGSIWEAITQNTWAE